MQLYAFENIGEFIVPILVQKARKGSGQPCCPALWLECKHIVAQTIIWHNSRYTAGAGSVRHGQERVGMPLSRAADTVPRRW